MHWPHRHFYGERCEERKPQPLLRLNREIRVQQSRNIRRAGKLDHPQHSDQHHERAEQGVEEEFVRRVNPVLSAPNTDDQIHRDQASFEEDVEQQQVLRRENANHQRFHKQERGHILTDALLYRGPACADANRHQEHGQHDKRQ